jgi:hypothetical protein
MTATDAASPLLFLCGAVAALWLISVFAPAVPALFLEGLEAATALRRGRELSRGRRWRILGVVLGLFTAVCFLYLGVGLIRHAVLASGGSNIRLFVSGFSVFVRSGLSYVLFSVGSVCVYQNLVVRKSSITAVGLLEEGAGGRVESKA